MTHQKKILVLFTPATRGLNAAYHAFSLAERIRARITVLYFKAPGRGPRGGNWLEEALRNITRDARQESLPVTFRVAEGAFEEEVTALIDEADIDLVVYDADDSTGPHGPAIRRIRSRVSIQFIEVKKKYDYHFNCLQGKEH